MKDLEKTYKNWDYDELYYWISVLCDNCGHNSQLAIKKGVKFYPSRLKFIPCSRCAIKGTLHKAMWNGKYYVKI